MPYRVTLTLDTTLSKDIQPDVWLELNTIVDVAGLVGQLIAITIKAQETPTPIQAHNHATS